VSGTLEDALRVEERPNLPGTLDEHPNWSIPLPVPLEELLADPFVARLAATLARGPSVA
jgi:4-alpha-glucanotransferase